MPSYDYRRKEVANALAGAGAELGAERLRIAAVLDEYFNARDAILTMIVTFLADDSAEPLTPEYNSKFRDTVRSAQDKLDNMLSGVSSPSAAAVKFREKVDFEEMAFWALVGKLTLAESRDLLITNSRNVREMISVLDKRWQNLSEEDLKVEQEEQKAAQDIKDMLETALATAMPYYVQAGTGMIALQDGWKKIGSTINDYVKATLVGAGTPSSVVDAMFKVSSWAGTAAQIASTAGVNIEVVNQAISIARSLNIGGLVMSQITPKVDGDAKDVQDAYDKAKKPLRQLIEGQYQANMTRYKSNLDNQGVVIVAYGGIRNQVDEFLKKTSLNDTRAAYDRIVADIDGLASGPITDGQKSDWADVRRSLKDIFDKRRADAEKSFDDFYRANDGRFMGGLSTDTEKALLNPDKWIVTINGIVAVGLDQKLREWREKVTVIQGGPKDAFDQIQNAFLGLPLEVRDQVQSGINTYLTDKMTKLNGEADAQIKTLEECSIMVKADKISSDMDRSRLRASLRATIR